MEKPLIKLKKDLFRSYIQISFIKRAIDMLQLAYIVPTRPVGNRDKFFFPPSLPTQLRKMIGALPTNSKICIDYDNDSNLYFIQDTSGGPKFDISQYWNVDDSDASSSDDFLFPKKQESQVKFYKSPVTSFKLLISFEDGDYSINGTEKQKDLLPHILSQLNSKDKTPICSDLMKRFEHK